MRQTDVEQVFGLSLELPTGEQYSELRQLDGHEKVTFVRADLTDHADQRWREVIEQSDAVVSIV